MPATNTYIKFSELPLADAVQSTDTIAVLPESTGVLSRTTIAHASTANSFGLGSGVKYGHNKVVDNLNSSVYADGEALSAHQGKVLSDNISGLASTVSGLSSTVSLLNSHLTASNNTPFRFGYNPDTQEYGYIITEGGADTVIPFRTKHTGTYKPLERKVDNDMGEKHYYRYVDTTAVPNYNSTSYSFPAGSTGSQQDLGETNTVRYVSASNVYDKGVADGKNVNNVHIDNPYYGYISGNAGQDRTFTNPYSVSARCYAYNGGYSGVKKIRIYVNGTLVADSGDTTNSQSWGGVVGVGGSVRMTHEGASGSSDKPCEVSLVWAASF